MIKKLNPPVSKTGDQDLLLRNEYLVAENRISRNQIAGRVRLTEGERTTPAALGKRLGKQALTEVMSVITPETLFALHQRLITKKFDGSQHRCQQKIEDSVVQFDHGGVGLSKCRAACAPRPR